MSIQYSTLAVRILLKVIDSPLRFRIFFMLTSITNVFAPGRAAKVLNQPKGSCSDVILRWEYTEFPEYVFLKERNHFRFYTLRHPKTFRTLLNNKNK